MDTKASPMTTMEKCQDLLKLAEYLQTKSNDITESVCVVLEDLSRNAMKPWELLTVDDLVGFLGINNYVQDMTGIWKQLAPMVAPILAATAMWRRTLPEFRHYSSPTSKFETVTTGNVEFETILQEEITAILQGAYWARVEGVGSQGNIAWYVTDAAGRNLCIFEDEGVFRSLCIHRGFWLRPEFVTRYDLCIPRPK
ncbi:uncharacterized protein LY89DRAFT_408953 [Mollisia scopiformis]|uniref:Uncharacterized protein n=1 Tax=Mollisia scopiformis TaxID=149040 RepID=A0A132B2J6_MOLSC|nr:uncharacterized protein LY89DRAFT_408953 [Mollisia scopiformis]KUJ06616.1 hypothetical protein LY89DRAFT_408953 [Mollisia scopiformis]